jgi:hypothetical protein
MAWGQFNYYGLVVFGTTTRKSNSKTTAYEHAFRLYLRTGTTKPVALRKTEASFRTTVTNGIIARTEHRVENTNELKTGQNHCGLNIG